LFYLKESQNAFTNVFKHCLWSSILQNGGLPYEYLRLPSIKHEKLPIVLSKSEVCGNVSMRKVTQAQNPYWFTLWLWSSLYRSRSVRLQDLDFDRKQLKVVQGKGRKTMYHFQFI
jgi:hypothetical protein